MADDTMVYAGERSTGSNKDAVSVDPGATAVAEAPARRGRGAVIVFFFMTMMTT